MNQLDSRVSRTENSPQSAIDANAVSSTQIASSAITTDAIASGAVTNDSIARGAVGTEQLGVINLINSDSSLSLNVGSPTGALKITGDPYPPPTSGTIPLSLNTNNQVVEGLDSSVVDTLTAALLNSGTSAVRIALETIFANPGDVKMIAGATPNAGWLKCDGSAISRTTYAKLYTAIGTSYGAGDGSTTFNLPNLQGKVPVGALSTDTDFTSIGKTGGEKTHVLTQAELASHTHTQTAHNHGVTDPGHGHGISDPGHGHGVYDPGHGHGVNDPGHGHGSSTLSGFMSYLTTNASRQRFAAGTSTSSYTIGTRASQIDDIGYATAANNYTGIGINGSGTNISINGNSTGVSVNGNTTGVTTQNSTPVIQSTGSNTAHNNLQPYIVLNYVIRY